ncbi:hypothetical protein DY000_02025002 [Brassica cretica]|uniref:DUF1985 domain-containing protein n=1 Tax=Brassica cretica TaxID=69181 RepID=A0ABQ7E725_BRACR|nr:hypothetical protein DY000_02025002 [Brassica cretica]
MSKSFSKAPPVPFEEVQKILQEELGRPIDNVLKPGIEDFLVADLNFIYDVSRIFEFLSLEFGRTSLFPLHDQKLGDIMVLYAMTQTKTVDEKGLDKGLLALAFCC